MPFTDPRELLLLQDIRTALLAIRTTNGYTLPDGTAGTYGFDVKGVALDPINIFDVSEAKCPFIICEPTDDGDRQFEPALGLEDTFIATLTCRVDVTGTDPSVRYTTGSRFAADLEIALTQDIERNGLACDTRLRKPSIYTSLSADLTVLVVQRVAIKLFRTFGDPR